VTATHGNLNDHCETPDDKHVTAEDSRLNAALEHFHAARQAMSDALGPMYHDFALLGMPTKQLPGIFAPNQQAKAPVIIAYLAHAIAMLRQRGAVEISAAELFCADGYYAMVARALGATRAVGIDNDRDGYLVNARRIADTLGLGNLEFRRQAVEDIDERERFSIVMNIGGLYHVADPEAVLDRSYRLATDYLIVQTVVSLATDDPDYYKAPGPGLPWGNRYSRSSFERTMARRGWRLLRQDFNELTEKARPEDRGSLYYLVEIER